VGLHRAEAAHPRDPPEIAKWLEQNFPSIAARAKRGEGDAASDCSLAKACRT